MNGSKILRSMASARGGLFCNRPKCCLQKQGAFQNPMLLPFDLPGFGGESEETPAAGFGGSLLVGLLRTEGWVRAPRTDASITPALKNLGVQCSHRCGRLAPQYHPSVAPGTRDQPWLGSQQVQSHPGCPLGTTSFSMWVRLGGGWWDAG